MGASRENQSEHEERRNEKGGDGGLGSGLADDHRHRARSIISFDVCKGDLVDAKNRGRGEFSSWELKARQEKGSSLDLEPILPRRPLLSVTREKILCCIGRVDLSLRRYSEKGT